MVVSMRPYLPENVANVSKICSSYPGAHGGPVHIGGPTAIGISVDDKGKIRAPDFGSTVEVKPGEIPLFWACGVTPMSVLQNTKLPMAITHYPGHMFVTDILSEDIRIRQ